MYKELTAAQITADALLMLKIRNFHAWRQVNTTVRGRKGIVNKGTSDIIGFNKSTGIFGACEVKKLGDKLSEDQKRFLWDVHQAGGMAMIATQGDGYFTVLVPFVDYIRPKFDINDPYDTDTKYKYE